MKDVLLELVRGPFKYNEFNNTWDNYGDNNGNIFIGDGDAFGDAISLSSDGKVIAIGVPGNNGTNNDKGHCGTVKVFQLNSSTNKWEQLGSNIDGETKKDFSCEHQGVKLSDDGMTVAIGSPGSRINGFNSGWLRVFKYGLNNGKWIQISPDIDCEEGIEGREGNFSRTVSFSGDGSIVTAGSCRHDSKRGHVRVYQQG